MRRASAGSAAWRRPAQCPSGGLRAYTGLGPKKTKDDLTGQPPLSQASLPGRANAPVSQVSRCTCQRAANNCPSRSASNQARCVATGAAGLTSLLRPNPRLRLGDAETDARVTGMDPVDTRNRKQPAGCVSTGHGRRVIVERVPRWWAARVQGDLHESRRGNLASTVLRGASRSDRWIAQATNRTQEGVRRGDHESHWPASSSGSIKAGSGTRSTGGA